MEQIFRHAQNWLWGAAIVAMAILAALLVHRWVFNAAERMTARTRSKVDNALVRHSRRPARLLLPLVAIFLALPAAPLPTIATQPLQHGIGLALIASVAWVFVGLTGVLDEIFAGRYAIDVKDNLAARRVRTQVQMLRRIVVVVVTVIAIALMLMTFPEVRRVGTSLLASAGIAGLVVGMAARPTLSSVIAGVQVALTEPIRLDDVVIVEGEWGRVEEINVTYVVVKIWDLRRLIVPLSHFIEHPFQNWTRTSANILGTVFLNADYSLPVEAVRSELKTILEASEKWDGEVCNLQVTDCDDRTIQLRALMSASDSGAAWDLRCHVREKLVEFIRTRYPECLPVARAELRRAGGKEGSLAPQEG